MFAGLQTASAAGGPSPLAAAAKRVVQYNVTGALRHPVALNCIVHLVRVTTSDLCEN